MSYLYDCSCNGGIIFGVSQCKSCGCSWTDLSGASRCSGPNLTPITQKRIWNTVRVPESEYIMNLASLNVYQQPLPEYANVNWNQYSDRPAPSNSHPNMKITTVPSRGNSTRSSITRLRPGSLKPGGTGVDIKHGSYDRYLARLKGKGPLRTQNPTKVSKEIALAEKLGHFTHAQKIALNNNVKGNKTISYGIVAPQNGKTGSCLCYN